MQKEFNMNVWFMSYQAQQQYFANQMIFYMIKDSSWKHKQNDRQTNKHTGKTILKKDKEIYAPCEWIHESYRVVIKMQCKKSLNA